MIEKKIHYCWFGDKPLPKEYQDYIAGWKRLCPDYEVIEWNEKNYDVTKVPYMAQAAKAGKWSFVSDYLGFDVVYEYGGIYLDTDVELVRSLDPVLDNEAFFAIEENEAGLEVAPGLGFGARAKHPLLKKLRDMYLDVDFIASDGSLNMLAVPVYTTKELEKLGYERKNELQKLDDVVIYPTKYFAPMDFLTGEIVITEKTLSIHHYSALWQSQTNLKHIQTIRKINRTFGKKLGMKINLGFRAYWALERRAKKLIGRDEQ